MGYSSAAEAKMNHWFSRKHQSAEVHSRVSEANQERRANKFYAAQDRAAEARQRKPEEQIDRLNRMFGRDTGAQRERVKLARRIELAKAPKKPVVATQKGDSPKKTQKGETPRRSKAAR